MELSIDVTLPGIYNGDRYNYLGKVKVKYLRDVFFAEPGVT